jgi:ribonuclease VapC
LTVFVDASAAVAILALEADHLSLSRQLQKDSDRIWSAIARWETFRGLSREFKLSEEEAEDRVRSFEAANRIKLVEIGEREAQLAIAAHVAFGRNKHPAQLNLGDCFAYACAKAHAAQLLYKGEDFARTDLA